MAARIGFTLWMLFWVSVVLANHGPQNFFWLCNLAQVWMPDPLWIAVLVIAYPLAIFLPGHFLVRVLVSKFR